MKRRLFKKNLQVPYCVVSTKYNFGVSSILAKPYKKFLGYDYGEETITNFIFEDILGFTHFSRGRSSVKAHFKSYTNDNRYEMFISDFEDVIVKEYTVNALEGEFGFRKQGKNFGVVLLEDDG